MSSELIAIFGVGVFLAAFMSWMVRRTEDHLRQEIQGFGERLRKVLDRSEENTKLDIQLSEERMRRTNLGSEDRMNSPFAYRDGRFTVLETRLSDIGMRLSRIEGLLEDLRDAITRRRTA